MKKLSTFAVSTVMDLLIHTNGKTSTLEVKNTLRHLGFQADQNEVSAIMDSITRSTVDEEEVEKYSRERETGNKYFTYYIDANYDGYEGGYADDFVDPTTITTPVPNLQNVTNDTVEPELVFYIDAHAKKHTENAVLNADKNAMEKWMVYHVDGDSEFHVYEGIQTRDKVRSRYTSLLKCKIQDVRACKVANYK